MKKKYIVGFQDLLDSKNVNFCRPTTAARNRFYVNLHNPRVNVLKQTL